MKLSTVTKKPWLAESNSPDISQYQGIQAKIANWLLHHDIQNFTINQDNTVDIKGDLHLIHVRTKKLPIQFGTVSGDIAVDSEMLESTWGLPKTLNGSLYWSGGKAGIDLSFLPEHIGGDAHFNWWEADFTTSSLKSVGGSFVIDHSKINTFEGFPNVVGGIVRVQADGDKNFSIKSFKGLPSVVKSGELELQCMDRNLNVISDLPIGVSSLTLSHGSGAMHGEVVIESDLTNCSHLNLANFGSIVRGLNNLPSLYIGNLAIGGTSLEGAPKVIKGALILNASENPELTKGMHKYIGGLVGRLTIYLNGDQGSPLLGVFRIPGLTRFDTNRYKNSDESRKATDLINRALQGDEADFDIHEFQEQMIDAGLGKFARI